MFITEFLLENIICKVSPEDRPHGQAERHSGKVVRATGLWYRKLQEGHEFKPGLDHLKTVKLSPSTLQ